jgi:HlyD family secretion protein
VQQGQLLFEIGGLNTLTVKVKVDEVDIGKVKVGQDLSVKNNAYPNDRFTGKVTRVAAAATAPDPKTGATGGSFYEVEGTVTNPDAKLRDGMSAEARVVTETRTQAMVVGLESIREEGDKAFALVVNDFKVELRPVKLGLRTQTQVEVTEGLQAGDQVVVAPFSLIKSFKGGEAVRAEVVPVENRGADE